MSKYTAPVVILILMVISAVGMMVMNFFEFNSTVTVHVIDTQSGRQVTYRAQQQDIKSRQFKTINGRIVYVADSERIEVESD